MIHLELEDAKEIINQFSHLVNHLSFKVEKTAEEYKNSEFMKDLDLCWIRILSSPNYRTDPRNEASSIKGKQLTSIPFLKKELENSNNPKMQEVAQKMAQEHRTIQQTFTQLVFCHFLHTCDQKETQILTDTMGEDFYRLPFI